MMLFSGVPGLRALCELLDGVVGGFLAVEREPHGLGVGHIAVRPQEAVAEEGRRGQYDEDDEQVHYIDLAKEPAFFVDHF